MKKMKCHKKAASLALAAVTALSLSTTAFAADPSSNNNVDVNGTIASVTSLDLVVPVSTTFTIDENRDFSSADLVIKNNSPVPVAVAAQKMVAGDSSPDVVQQDKFTDTEWHNLNLSETQSNIAMGVKVSNEKSNLVDTADGSTKWFGAETGDSNLNLGVIKSAYQADTIPQLTMNFDSKYGNVWGDMSSINYTLTLTFGVE